MAKVEAQAVRRNERAGLHDLRPEHVAQRRVQQVRGRVVHRAGQAVLKVDARLYGGAGHELVATRRAHVDEERHAALVRAHAVEDGHAGAAGAEREQRAAVAGLPAALRKEGAGRDAEPGRPRRGLGRRRGQERQHRGRDLARARVAGALRGEPGLRPCLRRGVVRASSAGELPRACGRGGRALALLLHARLEAAEVERDAALGADRGGEVGREAERVVELEADVARDAVPGLEALLQHAHAVFDGAEEALLLAGHHRGHGGAALAELGEGVRAAAAAAAVAAAATTVALALRGGRRQRALEHGQQVVQEGLALPGAEGEARGAAKQPPQHIAAPRVARHDAVGDQKGRTAHVVRHHVLRKALLHQQALLGRHGRGAQQRVRARHQRPQQVRLEVALDALQHARDALQAHARVHRGRGQRLQRAGAVHAVLHKDEVPDLEEARVIVRPARCAAVPEDLGARAARHARAVAHGPKVVRATLGVHRQRRAAHLAPQRRALGVALKHRHAQPLARKRELARHKLPRETDRLLLEVVPEGEVAQHLEHRKVPCSEAHVLQVVVLAARAHALLRRRRATGARALAQEALLELAHTRVGEHQRLVRRSGHQRASRHARVPALLEEAQERLARRERAARHFSLTTSERA